MARAPRLSPFMLLGIFLLAGFPPNAAWAETSSLPQPISAREAVQFLAHPHTGLEIVDIRPSDEYADYALPGSENLDPATVLADDTLLTGQAPLLFVDKDGTRAFAVAGRIAPKTSRKVMALTGGLAAWWKSQELDRATNPAQTPDSAPAPQNPGK